MNILTDKLPDGIYIDGFFYPVYTDFRNWLKIDALILKKEMSFCEKFSRIFALCYKKLPKSMDRAIEGIFEFYSCAKEPKKSSQGSFRLFSFDEDAELLYSAFFSQYGINLAKDSLHWFEFMALFSGLWDIHKFSKIVSFRSVDLSDIGDKRKKAFYSEMKKRYSLKDNRTKEEKDSEIAENMASLF